MNEYVPQTTREASESDYQPYLYKEGWKLVVEWRQLFSRKGPFWFLSWIFLPVFDQMMKPDAKRLRLGIDPFGRLMGLDESQLKTHVGLFSGSGSGKSVFGPIFWLLTSLRAGSILTIDPKTELVKVVAVLCRLRTHIVKVLQPGKLVIKVGPISLKYSERMNLLDTCLTFEGVFSDDLAKVLAWSMVKDWFSKQKISHHKFDQVVMERILLAGMTAYIMRNVDRQGKIKPPPFADAEPGTGAPPLWGLHDFFARSPQTICADLRACPNRVASNGAIVMEKYSYQAIQEILATICAGLAWTTTPDIAEFSHYSTCSFYSMAFRWEAWFLCFRAEKLRDDGSHDTLLNHCFVMLFHMLEGLAENQPGSKNEDQLKILLHVILEESGLYQVPQLPSLLAEIRSKRVAVLLIAQGFGQLRDKYGIEGAKTVAENLGHLIVIPGVGREMAQAAADHFGQTIHTMISEMEELGLEFGSSIIPELKTKIREGYNQILGDKMHPSVISKMADGLGLLIPTKNRPPMWLHMKPYYTWAKPAWKPIGTPKAQPDAPGSLGVNIGKITYVDVAQAITAQRDWLQERRRLKAELEFYEAQARFRTSSTLAQKINKLKKRSEVLRQETFYKGDPKTNYRDLTTVWKSVIRFPRPLRPFFAQLRKELRGSVSDLGWLGRVGLFVLIVFLLSALAVLALQFVH